jgi:hypothetical protein
MPKGKRTIVTIARGLPGQRVIAGNVTHMKLPCHHREHKFYPGRVSASEDGNRGNSYGEILENMLKKKENKK